MLTKRGVPEHRVEDTRRVAQRARLRLLARALLPAFGVAILQRAEDPVVGARRVHDDFAGDR